MSQTNRENCNSTGGPLSVSGSDGGFFQRVILSIALPFLKFGFINPLMWSVSNISIHFHAGCSHLKPCRWSFLTAVGSIRVKLQIYWRLFPPKPPPCPPPAGGDLNAELHSSSSLQHEAVLVLAALLRVLLCPRCCPAWRRRAGSSWGHAAARVDMATQRAGLQHPEPRVPVPSGSQEAGRAPQQRRCRGRRPQQRHRRVPGIPARPRLQQLRAITRAGAAAGASGCRWRGRSRGGPRGRDGGRRSVQSVQAARLQQPLLQLLRLLLQTPSAEPAAPRIRNQLPPERYGSDPEPEPVWQDSISLC